MHQLDLDLSRHCVLTEIKRRYEQALAEALQSRGEPSESEGVLEFLKAVLEQVDLVRLRGAIPELSGGGASEIRLEPVGAGGMRLMLDGREVFRQSLRVGLE